MHLGWDGWLRIQQEYLQLGEFHILDWLYGELPDRHLIVKAVIVEPQTRSQSREKSVGCKKILSEVSEAPVDYGTTFSDA